MAKHPHWATMTDDERTAYLQEARSRGGKTRCQQESMALARQKAYVTTLQRHPLAWSWLKSKIQRQNEAKGETFNLSANDYKEQRLRHLHCLYVRLETISEAVGGKLELAAVR